MYLLKITFKTNKKKDLNKLLLEIKKNIKIKNIKIKGIIKIKQKNKIFTVLKSPHVNKKSREQFNFKLYKQINNILIKDIYDLFNFLIFIKKIMIKYSIIQYQIIKY